ncbi:hypothetical protein [Alishewanella sp. HH-ZS]|uniref:hypothetical protein n=1 Tax=Alishewanella sp. HH-ZS TaxID=1856684 RepID=UPI0008237104|nr:hypothetical protein [Alishewanella sp. HH-ZS]OCW96051.1 hypothetical protein A9165_13415 [Alishewanella sp. HH-ZS]
MNFVTEMAFVKIAAVLGFGSGLVLSLLLVLASSLQIIGIDDLSVVVKLPFISTLGLILNALLGYPLYKLYCNKVKGQVVSGKFLELDGEDV